MDPIKLCDLSLEQLVDIQGEHFADNFEAGTHDDTYSNHVNRHVVWGLQRKHGRAFLGRICYKPGDALSPLREWEGERIDAFSADFVVPADDKILVDLITAWNATGDVQHMFGITERISLLGGISLHWFNEPARDELEDAPEYDLGDPI